MLSHSMAGGRRPKECKHTTERRPKCTIWYGIPSSNDKMTHSNSINPFRRTEPSRPHHALVIKLSYPTLLHGGSSFQLRHFVGTVKPQQ